MEYTHKQLIALIKTRTGKPVMVRELMRLLKLKTEDRHELKRALNELVLSGELVKTRGPAVHMKLMKMGNMNMGAKMHMGKAGPYAMAHMGATLKVTFPQAGTYRFKLMDRGDYYPGIKTTGPDNKPTLTVVVS